MSKINPFDTQRYDLGTSNTTLVGKADIDQSFKVSHTVSNPCIFCSNAASHKIIPKRDALNTVEIEDKGFICEHCITQGYLDKKDYGIRDLGKRGGIV